jgi:hypothetical protein
MEKSIVPEASWLNSTNIQRRINTSPLKCFQKPEVNGPGAIPGLVQATGELSATTFLLPLFSSTHTVLLKLLRGLWLLLKRK